MMKPEMGIFIIKNNSDNKCYIEASHNLRGAMNSIKFKLNFGNHPNKELQKAWTEYGEDCFTIEVLEKLEYDKDESKTDYSEELEILKIEWEENLSKQGLEFYVK